MDGIKALYGGTEQIRLEPTVLRMCREGLQGQCMYLFFTIIKQGFPLPEQGAASKVMLCLLLLAPAQRAARPGALLCRAGMWMGIRQLSVIGSAKKHIFQCPNQTELGQVTPRAPEPRCWGHAAGESGCACPALFSLNVKEWRNETICLGRLGTDSRQVLFWVNVKHFTGALSPCVCCWSLFRVGRRSYHSTESK